MRDMGERLLARLERIEKSLANIEENGRPDDHVTNPTKRFDGKQVSSLVYTTNTSRAYCIMCQM